MKRRQTKRHRSSSSSGSSITTSSSSSDGISSSCSSRSSSSSSISTSSNENSKKKTNRKPRRKRSITSSEDEVQVKHTKQKAHKIKKKKRKTTENLKSLKKAGPQLKPDTNVENECSDIPISLMEGPKSLAPLTKEEWEKQQSKVKKVLDESTGRYRLIKGDGEVLEEIVSHEKHKAINKQATKGDGNYFQAKTTAGLLNK